MLPQYGMAHNRDEGLAMVTARVPEEATLLYAENLAKRTTARDELITHPALSEPRREQREATSHG